MRLELRGFPLQQRWYVLWRGLLLQQRWYVLLQQRWYVLSGSLGEIGRGGRYDCCQSYSTVGLVWLVLGDPAHVQKQHRDFSVATALLSPLRLALWKAPLQAGCCPEALAPSPTLAAWCRPACTGGGTRLSPRGLDPVQEGCSGLRGGPPPASSPLPRLHRQAD